MLRVALFDMKNVWWMTPMLDRLQLYDIYGSREEAISYILEAYRIELAHKKSQYTILDEEMIQSLPERIRAPHRLFIHDFTPWDLQAVEIMEFDDFDNVMIGLNGKELCIIRG